MRFDFNGIIDDFVNKYGLSRRRVIAEIEKTLSIMLSRWYGMEVIAMYISGQLNIFGYIKSQGCYIQREFDLTGRNPKGWNTIKRLIEQNMLKAATNEHYFLYRHISSMGWGTIVKIVPGDKLLVYLQLSEGLDIYADCPLAGIGGYERLNGAFAIGEKRAFGVKAMHPVTSNGIPRIYIELSRTLKQLPAMLLAQQVGDRLARIRCIKRFAGKKSFVNSNRFVPKSMILRAEDELHEHIQVSYER